MCVTVISAATLFWGAGGAAQPLSDKTFIEEDQHLIDTHCSAVFRLMADIGAQRASQLTDVYSNASEFMAVTAVAKYSEQFGTPQETSESLVKARILQEHEKYVAGIESTDQTIATRELGRFVKDVQFCNHRIQVYEQKIKEAG